MDTETKPSDQSGFTLLEVLVGMTLLAMVALSHVGLTTQTLRMQLTAAETSRSAAAAQFKLEELRRQPYAALVAGGSLTAAVSGYHQTRPYERGADLQLRWQITDKDDGNYKEIRLLSYTSASSIAVHNAPREVRLVTYRARS